MPFFSVSLTFGSHTERYSGVYVSAEAAAKEAVSKHEKSVDERLKGATGKYKRTLEASRVPKLVEVSGSDGRLVETFDCRLKSE